MRWKTDIFCQKCKGLIKQGEEFDVVDSQLNALLKLHVCKRCRPKTKTRKIKLKKRR